MRAVLFCLLFLVSPALAAPEHPAVAVCFTPGADCDSNLIELIDSAQKTVRVAAYTLTSAPIADALIRARQRNVKVWVVLDKNQWRARKAQERNAENMLILHDKPTAQRYADNWGWHWSLWRASGGVKEKIGRN